MNRLIHIGFGNIVNTSKIIAIVSPDSAPVKRLVQKSKRKRYRYRCHTGTQDKVGAGNGKQPDCALGASARDDRRAGAGSAGG